MWAIVQLENPVWHIDATGGIIKNRRAKKNVFAFDCGT